MTKLEKLLNVENKLNKLIDNDNLLYSEFKSKLLNLLSELLTITTKRTKLAQLADNQACNIVLAGGCTNRLANLMQDLIDLYKTKLS